MALEDAQRPMQPTLPEDVDPLPSSPLERLGRPRLWLPVNLSGHEQGVNSQGLAPWKQLTHPNLSHVFTSFFFPQGRMDGFAGLWACDLLCVCPVEFASVRIWSEKIEIPEFEAHHVETGSNAACLEPASLWQRGDKAVLFLRMTTSMHDSGL